MIDDEMDKEMQRTPRINATQQQIDVLLRHRLLPQSGGFEGFRLAAEKVPPDGLFVAPLRDQPHRLGHRRIALDAVGVNSHPRNRAVAEISYLLDLSCEVRENVEKALPPVPDAIVAAIGAAPFDLHPVRDELQLGITEREVCIEVAAVEGVKRSVKELDVLL
jgi:hypothetical protein